MELTADNALQWRDGVSEYGIPYREADVTPWAASVCPEVEEDDLRVTLRVYPKTIILGVETFTAPDEGPGAFDSMADFADMTSFVVRVKKFPRSTFNKAECTAALQRIVTRSRGEIE